MRRWVVHRSPSQYRSPSEPPGSGYHPGAGWGVAMLPILPQIQLVKPGSRDSAALSGFAYCCRSTRGRLGLVGLGLAFVPGAGRHRK